MTCGGPEIKDGAVKVNTGGSAGFAGTAEPIGARSAHGGKLLKDIQMPEAKGCHCKRLLTRYQPNRNRVRSEGSPMTCAGH